MPRNDILKEGKLQTAMRKIGGTERPKGFAS